MEVYTQVTQPELFVSDPHSLESVVNWMTVTDPHWNGGIKYDVDCGDVAVTSMTCISGSPSSMTKAHTFRQITRGARPFTVYAEVDCTPDQLFWDTSKQSALRALANTRTVQLERTFWSGASGGAPVFPNLSDIGPIYDNTGEILLQPSATIISGSPLDIVEGLGRLEEAFGDCYPGQGVIHVPAELASTLGVRNLVRHEGNKLLTHNDDVVVLGNGYSLTIGPGGTTPPTGSAWIHMTSPIFGIKGQPRTFDPVTTLNRDTDTMKMIAEQTFVLAWECCLVSVLVTLGGDQSGAYGNALQAF